MTTDLSIDLSIDLRAATTQVRDPERFQLSFGHACAQRVRHLLEDEEVIGCLDVLGDYLAGRVDRAVLLTRAARAAELARHHPGSRSLDGVGHAAVSASHAVANALAGRASQAADYAAYAVVYGEGGYGAVGDADSYLPERTWQQATLQRLAATEAGASRA
ncbi:MAG: hypothetical protein JOY84_18450 [Curvibacter sp.]|nr:hypothetical protein [Curvibacter sp.]